MGYTHYYYVRQEYDTETFGRVARDLKKMTGVYERLGMRLGDGMGEARPVITADEISFNGLRDCGHRPGGGALRWESGASLSERTCPGSCMFETFRIRRRRGPGRTAHGGMYFSCTKTNRLPYDLAVTTALIIAKRHMGGDITVRSDGGMSQWRDAMGLCQRFLGYGSEFCLDD